jgi:hypothetical protein
VHRNNEVGRLHEAFGNGSKIRGKPAGGKFRRLIDRLPERVAEIRRSTGADSHDRRPRVPETSGELGCGLQNFPCRVRQRGPAKHAFLEINRDEGRTTRIMLHRHATADLVS